MKNTLIIITGGTIEALYAPEEGTPYHVPVPATVEQSAIPEALAKLGLQDQCDLWPCCMYDSKQLSPELLNRILGYIETHGYRQVVMVQGTDTMPQNGRYFAKLLQDWEMPPITLVLTGAMQPLRNAQGAWREASDGWKNLRMAIADARELSPPGVYIEMGEGPWDPHYVEKEVRTHAVPAAGGNAPLYVAQSGFVLRKERI